MNEYREIKISSKKETHCEWNVQVLTPKESLWWLWLTKREKNSGKLSFLSTRFFQPKGSCGVDHMDHTRVLLEMFLSYGSNQEMLVSCFWWANLGRWI